MWQKKLDVLLILHWRNFPASVESENLLSRLIYAGYLMGLQTQLPARVRHTVVDGCFRVISIGLGHWLQVKVLEVNLCKTLWLR